MLVNTDLGDVLGVGTNLVVDVLGMDTQLVVEVAGCWQCPHHHDQLCTFITLVHREL